MIIIVPGNPGLASFYEVILTVATLILASLSLVQEFMLTLQEQLGDPALTIWAFSYIGHETRSPSLVPTGHCLSPNSLMMMMTTPRPHLQP